VQQAIEISNALRGSAPVPAELDVVTRKRIAFVKTVVGQCQAAGDDAAQVDALILLAGRTIPFLDSEGLDGVWAVPSWIGCAPHSTAVRGTLEVLDAMARRDFGAAGARATALLEQQKRTLSPLARDWLLRGAMLNALARHDYDSVRTIDETIGKDVMPSVATQLQRSYMLALADAGIRRSREGKGTELSQNR
jgi:hypothetical protein